VPRDELVCGTDARVESVLRLVNVFLMRWGIYLIMKIKFRYQLSGLVLASNWSGA
jgi:hypothetical protein